MRHRTGYRAPSPSPRPDPLFPGGQVRQLWNVPQPPVGDRSFSSDITTPSQPGVSTPEAGSPTHSEVLLATQIQNTKETTMTDNLSPSPAEGTHATAPRRPHRNFPLYFVDDPDHPGQTTIMMADELAAYQAKVDAANAACQAAAEESRAARHAELAAGRPADPNLGGRSFSSDISLASLSGVSTPEVANVSSPAFTDLGECSDPALAGVPNCPENPSPATTRPPDYSRHSRRCLICAHPDRDAIEADFIRWRSPKQIARDYSLSDRSSLYRHVHATGLFERRRNEIARVLENALEEAESCPFAEFDIITRAVRIYCRLDARGRIYEPPRTLNINITRTPADVEPRDTRAVLASASPEIDLAVGRGQNR